MAKPVVSWCASSEHANIWPHSVSILLILLHSPCMTLIQFVPWQHLMFTFPISNLTVINKDRLSNIKVPEILTTSVADTWHTGHPYCTVQSCWQTSKGESCSSGFSLVRTDQWWPSPGQEAVKGQAWCCVSPQCCWLVMCPTGMSRTCLQSCHSLHGLGEVVGGKIHLH